MIIDSHLHVWSDYPQYYPWADDGPSQPGSIELLLTTMEEHGVDKACLVQSIHYLFDNRYVADCLTRYPGRFSAIGSHGPQLTRISPAAGTVGNRRRLRRASYAPVTH